MKSTRGDNSDGFRDLFPAWRDFWTGGERIAHPGRTVMLWMFVLFSLGVGLSPRGARSEQAAETETGATGGTQDTLSAAIARGEDRLVQGDAHGTAEIFRSAMLRAGDSPADGLEIAEVELALVRLARLRHLYGDAEADRPLLEKWSARTDLPLAAATARRHLGFLQLRLAQGAAAARETWKPLLYLEQFHVVGPFDNERGGGFLTAYEPEKEIDLSAEYDGKSRTIHWRPLPASPFAGNVDLGGLFEPNEESLAYALTYVHSETDQPAALRIGSKDGFRIWVNRELVGSAELRRPFRRDQNALGVRLRQGWNTLLFKLPQSKGAWRFAARLSRPDGSPLTGVREGQGAPDSEIKGSDDNEANPETQAPEIATGSIMQLEQRLEGHVEGSDANDARLCYVLGALLLERQAHDEGEHPDTRWLSRAVQLDPQRAIYHLDLARSRKRTATIAAQQEENAWRRAVEAAVELDSATAAYRLGSYYERQFGNHERALFYLGRALTRNSGHEEAILLKGAIEAELDFPGAEERADTRLKALTKKSVQTRLRLTNRLAKRGDLKSSIERLESLLKQDALQSEARQMLGAQYLADDRMDEAIAIYREGSVLSPHSMNWQLKLVSLFEGREQFEEAVVALDRAIEIRPDDAELHARRGKLLLRLDERGQEEREAALASLDEALRLQPNSPQLREYVEFLRNSQDQFERLFRRDVTELVLQAFNEIKTVRDKTVPDKKGSSDATTDDSPARALLDLEAVQVNQDGTTKNFSQSVIQILNDQGVRQYDRFETYYARGEQSVEFKKARVHHIDGRVSDAELERFGGGSRSERGEFARASIDLAPLSKGDVVEVEFVREDLRQSFFGDYYGHREVFQNTIPVTEKTFVLRVPQGREFNFHQRNLDIEAEQSADPEAQTVTYTWTMRDIEKLETEPGMPPMTEVSPVLEISTFRTWTDFTTWYWNLIRKQFESSPEIRRKVRELTSGAPDDLAKVRAVYNYVVTDVRYNMWEFGVHGFKPYNAANIFTRKFGDCKDKATLMSVMLKEVGIDAYPVLIYGTQSRAEEDISLPLVNHFNHCISYVPAGEGRDALFLDGTAQYHNFRELPSMDRGANVLVVTPEGGQLEEVPWNTPDRLSLQEETTVTLRDDLSADYHTRLRLDGDYAVFVRQMFEIDAQRKTELEKILSRRFASSTVEEQEFSRLDRLDEPVTFSVRVTVPRFIVETPSGLALRAERDFFSTRSQLTSLGGLEKRAFDVLLGNPRRSILRTVYKIPPGLKLKSLPEAQEETRPFGRFKITYSAPAPDEIVVERIIEITAPRVDVASYPLFREFAAALERLEDQRVQLERS